MKILVISDSHGRNDDVERVISQVKNFDVLIHLGDIERGDDFIRSLVSCPTYMVLGNNDYRLDYYDLESYGMCGGSIECYGCLCGAQMGWQYFTDCDWTFLGEQDPETGARMRHCENCDTYACFEDFTEEFPDECLRKGSFICKLIRNDEELLNINAPICEESHTYNLNDWKLNGTSCEEVSFFAG